MPEDPKENLEEKVTTNTEFEYESEVTNPHPEPPEDYVPSEEEQAVIDKRKQLEDLKEFEKIQDEIVTNVEGKTAQLESALSSLTGMLDDIEKRIEKLS